MGLKRLDLFEPDSSVAHSNPTHEASNKALGAAIITLAPDLTRKVASRLGEDETTIKNFRKELTSGRLKSPIAKSSYDLHLGFMQHSDNSRERAKSFLKVLEPVTKKSDIK